jgi:hypothetical protein
LKQGKGLWEVSRVFEFRHEGEKCVVADCEL